MILRTLISEKSNFSKNKKRNLIISSFFIPKDLFCKSPFIVQYTLEKKIMVIILANIYAIRYNFINENL